MRKESVIYCEGNKIDVSTKGNGRGVDIDARTLYYASERISERTPERTPERAEDRDIRETKGRTAPKEDTSLKIMFWATIGVICVVIAELLRQVITDYISTL